MIPSQFVSRITLQRDKVADFGAYPFCLPVVRHLAQLDLHPRLTFFVGENGSGKSTLLEALAVSLGFNAEGGSRNFAFSTRASHSELHAFLRVAKGFRRPRTGYFLRAESFFNVATEIERMDAEPAFGPPIIDSYGGRSLHAQSHGESFMALLTERFRGDGLYILDEPEAALSPQRQLAALARIHELVQGGAQFVIATHSPLLISYPDAWIYQCGAAGLQRVRAEDTEHFQLTRDFLVNPDRFLRQLLD
ncbi:AAA family ATPase [Pseudacidovorax sp. NFM-22]|uniref:AAA family ATPase n=1 Tax=Pseudacidovorax sp. NFM-22 TaxID=2744469 RepID=UPI001F31657A|nr:AAA family ATPase [Pseudacidovorax sp. NFM-22]